MTPLVSILIPAYNARRWIADAIRSALAQTWAAKEIVVVDDGSSDGTLAIARGFASRSVAVVTQDNQGASAARNRALAISQGDYVQWLDADDLLDPRKVASQLRALAGGATPRTLLSGAWGRFAHRPRKARFEPTLLWSDLTPLDWLLGKMGHNLHMQTDSWLVSRELSDAAGPWNTGLWRDNDGEYFCRVILASDGIRFVPEALSYYRASGAKSVSHIGGSSKKLESLFLSMRLHIAYLRSLEDSDRTRRACRRYIRTWLYEFYPYRLDLAGELQRVAAELGGPVETPRLSWKYDWIVRCFGWGPGRRAQLALPRIKASLLSAWDQAMLHLEARALRPVTGRDAL